MTVKIILKPVKTAKTKFNKDIYQQKNILIRTKMNISSYSYLRLIMEYLKHNNYCIKSQF